MEKRRRVLVYGRSLHMAGMVASLKAHPTLDVLCVDIDSPQTPQSVDKNDVAAIVFDLGDPPHCLDISLLRDLPGLLSIGVDFSSDAMLIFCSQPAQALSVADLVHVICQRDFSIEIQKAGDPQQERQS